MNGTSAISARPRSEPWGESPGFARGWAVFLREAIANPRSIGAVMPSSPALARGMAHRLDLAEDDGIIELGAGTGVVTRALRRRVSAPHQLVAIERSPVLADLLRTQFPDTKVICGDAAKLRHLIRRALPNAQRLHVVSSLPLRSLPADQVRIILREISGVLQSGGSWIQYTYALADRRVPDGFVRVASSFVWRNVPPARIDVFKRESAS